MPHPNDSEIIGTLDGLPVQRFTLRNTHGMTAEFSELGASLSALQVPDRHGVHADVVLGFGELAPCLAASSPYFGATVGRVANRILNARCEVQGQTLTLARNAGDHHLHGGLRGFDKRVWSGKRVASHDSQSVEFEYVSPAGEEGYPGQLLSRVRYALTDSNELRVEMSAQTSEPTLVNLAHHSYWNLNGHDSGNVFDHELQIHATHFTPAEPIPDGRVLPVEGTPHDFRQLKNVGMDLQRAGAPPVGFDHNWVVDGERGTLRPVALLRSPASGRMMTLVADQPGVQFYSGNFLDGSHRGKSGAVYGRHAGLCLETQCHPNSINVPEWREDVMLLPGSTYTHRMVHRFETFDETT